VNFSLREPYNNIPLTFMCSRDQQDSASGADASECTPISHKGFWHLVHHFCTNVVQYTNIVYCIQQYLHE